MKENIERDVQVCIVDYGLGNLGSVRNALRNLPISVGVSGRVEDIKSATHLILPGVGSFQDGMQKLRERGLIELLHEEVLEKKKMILGICLGMQLFASYGNENGKQEGLGFIKGEVVRIDDSHFDVRLPHIGWNDVTVMSGHAITLGFSKNPIFYFVHSYHVVPEDPSIIAGVTEYGGKVTALIQTDNICGAQFHPEKSHTDGMQIFKNFITC